MATVDAMTADEHLRSLVGYQTLALVNQLFGRGSQQTTPSNDDTQEKGWWGVIYVTLYCIIVLCMVIVLAGYSPQFLRDTSVLIQSSLEKFSSTTIPEAYQCKTHPNSTSLYGSAVNDPMVLTISVLLIRVFWSAEGIIVCIISGVVLGFLINRKYPDRIGFAWDCLYRGYRPIERITQFADFLKKIRELEAGKKVPDNNEDAEE